MKTFIHTPITIESIDSVTSPDGNRVYSTPDGKLYPSVTTVLSEHNKKGILEWRSRVGDEAANKISRKASTRGTKFHSIAENYLQNNAVDHLFKTPLDRMMFTLAQPILDRIDNIHAQEVGLWSHHLRLAGRVDCVAEFDRKLSIIDFKSSNRKKDEQYIQHYFMQAAAYAVMYEERTTIPVNRLVIAIAVEEDEIMQIFQGKRDNYISQVLHYRDLYEHK